MGRGRESQTTPPLKKSALNDVIEGHARSLDVADTKSDQIAAFAERIEKVENLIEQLGQSAALVTALTEYVADARAELSSIKSIRFWSVLLAVLFIIGLSVTFFSTMTWNRDWFEAAGSYTQGAFIIATVGAPLTLLIVILKGSFRSMAERNKDDFLPENLKEMIGAMKSVFGR